MAASASDEPGHKRAAQRARLDPAALTCRRRPPRENRLRLPARRDRAAHHTCPRRGHQPAQVGSGHAGGAWRRRQTRWATISRPGTMPIERVETAAGRFDSCLRVQGIAQIRLYVDAMFAWCETPLATTEWYCPGVGLGKLARLEASSSKFLSGGRSDMELVGWHQLMRCDESWSLRAVGTRRRRSRRCAPACRRASGGRARR